MTVNVKAAKLVNVITYQTHAESLKKVKKDMADLVNSFKKMNIKSADFFNSKRVISDAKATAQQAARAYNSEYAKSLKVIKQPSTKVPTSHNNGQMFPNAKPYDPAVVQSQNKQMHDASVAAKAAADTKTLAANQKKADAARKLALNRDINATMKLRQMAFNINQIQSLGVSERYKAIQQAKDLADQYRKAAIDIKEMNEQMRQLSVLTKNAGRAQAQSNRAIQQAAKAKGNAGVVAGGLLGGVTGRLLGGLGAGYLAHRAYGAASETLDTRSEDMHKLYQGSKAVGTDPTVVQGLVQFGKDHGVDSASQDKILDNLKDIQERTSDFLNNATKKNGQWTGGGQLDEAANVLKLDKSDIQKFEGKPAELANMLVNRGQQLGISEQEMGHLLENLGDDFSYYRKAFTNDGQELFSTMDTMNKNGQVISHSMLESAEKVWAWDQSLEKSSNMLGNEFTVGFSNGMKGIAGMTQAAIELRPVFKNLGEFVGETATHFSDLISFMAKILPDHKQVNKESGWYYDDSWMGKAINYIKEGIAAANAPTPESVANPSMSNNSNSMFSNLQNGSITGAGMGYNNPLSGLSISPVINVQTTPNITIQPDGSLLDGVFKAYAADAIGNEFRNQTLNLIGGVSSF